MSWSTEPDSTAPGSPVFLFDIDHFKNYNDQNGHIAGDQALRLLAQLVRDSVRADDIFGRFGGEEFLLIMPGRTPAQAMSAASNIRQRIATLRLPVRRRQPMGRVTISGGVATFPDDAQDAVELLLAADNALYRAKQAGRNKVLRAETGLNPTDATATSVDLDDDPAIRVPRMSPLATEDRNTCFEPVPTTRTSDRR